MVEIPGVDYSYDRPDPAGLAAAGKKFAVRYGALGNAGKHLSAAEVTALGAAGLSIVANVEETARAYLGAAAGTRHALAGDAFFRALGMPAGRPVYFSVDWDAGPADWPGIDAALRASAAVLGPGRVGVYGSYDTVAHCAAAGTAAWFWQTYAWSGGLWHPAADLQQYKNGVALAGGTVDLTRAVTADYGQWGGGDVAWVLVPCLIALRGEFNTVAPERDKASDGSIGDPAHQQEASDHNPDETGNTGGVEDADTLNEVHAIDVDESGPWPVGFTMEKAVQYLLGEARAGREKRLRYIIYRRRIWSASSGWVEKAYTGANPHDKHAHFSASYVTAQESDTSPWGVADLGDDMVFTDAQMRAFPWQYTGGGIPAGMSTLGVLNELVLASRAQKLRDEAILAAVRDKADTAAILARVDERAAQLAADVAQVDEQVWAKVPDPHVTAAEKAALLRAALGDDAAEVGRLLAGITGQG